MALSDKVNLQVKNASSSSNYVQYAFKFISYENKVINLNDYRIVAYFNTFRGGSIFKQERILSGYPSGSTSGSLSNTAGDIITDFFTVTNPPRIYPTTERYDKEVYLPLAGTAACLSANAYFDNIIWQIRFNSGQDFISENIGTSAYTIGLDAFADSYSYEVSTSYIDNPTFILEYNDPTYGWVKVLEYTNASTVDTNTGLYPYDEIFESKKAIGDINRQYGWDTTYDHDGLIAAYDSVILQSSPESTFTSATTYSLNGSGTGTLSTSIILYKFATDALVDKIISAAELYTYFTASNQAVAIECRANANEYTSGSTWDSIGGWSGTSGQLQSRLNISLPYQFQQSYIAHNVDKLLVQDWKDTSANNFGLCLRYIDPTDKAGYNSPTIASTENVSYIYLPTLFVYSGPISAAGSNYIRWKGTTNDSWSVGSNWEGDNVPLASDFAVFEEAYYSNPCTLDSDHAIKNILTTSGASYSGSINLSANVLTFYDTISAVNFSNFTNFIASAATIELKANVGINATSGCHIKKLVLNSGSTLQAPYLIVGTLDLKNSSTFGSTSPTNILSIRDNIQLEIGDEVLNTFTLNVEKNAIIPENGTLSLNSINYIGSSNITSRIYNCNVNIVLPYTSSYSYTSACSAVLVSGGSCFFNQRFTIVDPNTEGTSDSILTLDLNSNGNNIRFSNGFHIDDYGRKFVNIIFPSFFSFFTGDLNISDGIISTSNTENCAWSLNGNNVISLVNYDTSAIYMPHIEKYDAGIVTLSNINSPSRIIFESIRFGSQSNIDTPTIDFNGNNFNSKGLMAICSNGSNILDIGGSVLSAVNMNFYRDWDDSGSFVGSTAWSAFATNQLQSDGVTLTNSIAASATGFAIRSFDGGGNVNWFFDTIPPIITETSASPSHFSQTPVSAYYSVYDAGEFDANTIAITNGFGTLLDVIQYDTTSATFMVVISGTQKCGMIEISASDFSGNISEFTSLPFSYDYTSPDIAILNYSPATGVSNSFIDIFVSAKDNCVLSGYQRVFASEFNGQPAQIGNVIFSDEKNATSTIRISSTTPITNGDFYISATDAALNTTVYFSSAFSIATLAPQITFENSPNFKIGSTVILVSAVFEDSIGMSNVIPYSMHYNDVNIPFDTIYETATKVILSAVIPSTRGSGSISVTGFNTAGVSAVGVETGYSFIPVIVFGDPVPSNISKTTIIVPISAIGNFVNDAEYYYVRLNNSRMTISEPTSGSLDVLGYNFEYLSFSATVSSMTDLYGDLVISAGYR